MSGTASLTTPRLGRWRRATQDEAHRSQLGAHGAAACREAVRVLAGPAPSQLRPALSECLHAVAAAAPSSNAVAWLGAGFHRPGVAGNDIAKASSLARKMVCEWGMSERLGPIAFGQARSEPFLGRDIQRKQNYSEATAQAIDEEVHRIIDEQYARAKKLLQDNWSALERVATERGRRRVVARQLQAARRGWLCRVIWQRRASF